LFKKYDNRLFLTGVRTPDLPTTMATAVQHTSDPEAIRRAMFEDGIVVVPDAVDEPLRRAALRAINTEVGGRVPALLCRNGTPRADRTPRQSGSLLPTPSSARVFRRSRRSALPTAFSSRTSWFGRPSSTSTTSRAPARRYRRCWARRTPFRAARLRTAPHQYALSRSGQLDKWSCCLPSWRANSKRLRFPGAMCLDHSTYTPAPWWNQAWHIDGLTDEKEQFAKKGRGPTSKQPSRACDG